MRTAIVYASVHHGNTEKLVKRIAEECQMDLIDAVKQPDADLSSYDMIGFASGIYFSKFHQSILEFAEKNLPDDKKVFLICTYGGSANYKSIEQILDKKRSKVIGKFGCKGYDTFGPFKLVGGIAKGHPDEKDIKNALPSLFAYGCKCIVYTQGKDGATLYRRNDSISSKGHQVHVVDTTGAGDSFIGAFLYCLLKENISDLENVSLELLKHHLEFANLYAAHTTTMAGALAAMADPVQLREFKLTLAADDDE